MEKHREDAPTIGYHSLIIGIMLRTCRSNNTYYLSMSQFTDFGLNPALLKAITELGFENPMPIQEQSLPVLLEKDVDFVGLAQTGTGKTAAFGLPLLQKINADERCVQALILCPTRKLCMQITRDLKSYSKFIPEILVVPISTQIGRASCRERV